MAKVHTKKIPVSKLKAGMVLVIPAQKGVVIENHDVDKQFPTLSKGIRLIEMKAQKGPWKGAIGKAVILESDMVEIEIASPPLRRAFNFLAEWFKKNVF